jgi:sulfite reductase alpha subunit-like flavoprotein
MPAGVKQAIREAAQKYGGKTEDEARDFVIKMEKEGRLIEECWS